MTAYSIIPYMLMVTFAILLGVSNARFDTLQQEKDRWQQEAIDHSAHAEAIRVRCGTPQ